MFDKKRDELTDAFTRLQEERRIRELLGPYGIDLYCEHLQETKKQLESLAEIITTIYIKERDRKNCYNAYMQKVIDIYEKYRIMPTLQQHQLRVAAVAAMICDSLPEVEKEVVVTACLFHDMGNIIKFDLSYFPEFLEPEGLEYWENVKQEYIKKYGPDEHIATKQIAYEIELPESAMNCLDAIGFSKLIERVDDPSLEKKICCYADQRVGPHGVLSIHERLEDGRKRYAGRTDKIIASEKFETLATALEKVEKQIFKNSSIKPDDITDGSIQSYIDALSSKS